MNAITPTPRTHPITPFIPSGILVFDISFSFEPPYNCVIIK
jgi:hypothetical protein